MTAESHRTTSSTNPACAPNFQPPGTYSIIDAGCCSVIPRRGKLRVAQDHLWHELHRRADWRRHRRAGHGAAPSRLRGNDGKLVEARYYRRWREVSPAHSYERGLCLLSGILATCGDPARHLLRVPGASAYRDRMRRLAKGTAINASERGLHGMSSHCFWVEGKVEYSYLVLLRVGFTIATPVASRAVRSYRTLSPLPPRRKPRAVCFLWHFPWARAPQALPGTLPCGARTFLRAHAATGTAIA